MKFEALKERLAAPRVVSCNVNFIEEAAAVGIDGVDAVGAPGIDDAVDVNFYAVRDGVGDVEETAVRKERTAPVMPAITAGQGEEPTWSVTEAE